MTFLDSVVPSESLPELSAMPPQTGASTASPVPVDPPLWGADPGERQATVGRQSHLAAPASHCAEGTISAQRVGQHPIDTQFRKFVNEAEI
ncbi:hypothetical protein N7508_001725 [Penicillium antarcticum]|uniref:uncharacterized protein n=1 Tax=Penicillium antarcticum TaxID=416450 RepID=UPI002387748A|nr:uncharacterized protein N7508_001725 [Penicillium antarcticum]KAJ5317217.1 hypothetical protein N7508_001725 [Penicillium antarcticum]